MKNICTWFASSRAPLTVSCNARELYCMALRSLRAHVLLGTGPLVIVVQSGCRILGQSREHVGSSELMKQKQLRDSLTAEIVHCSAASPILQASCTMDAHKDRAAGPASRRWTNSGSRTLSAMHKPHCTATHCVAAKNDTRLHICSLNGTSHCLEPVSSPLPKCQRSHSE